ncbi:ribonuclease HII [bacterium]|nr:MAG: ribonuclease HII [bacterium]
MKRQLSLPTASPDFSREAVLYAAGRTCVVGVDEAGRGPLAGPVVAGAAVLPRDFAIQFESRINDSKKLTHAVRVELAEIIKQHAAWGLGVVSHEEIDEMNIRRASWDAMRRAVLDLAARFPQHSPDYVLADGLAVKEMEWPWERDAIVKGDALCSSIAAASILAKVARDEFMTEMEEQFPGYGFAKHKGYPTPAHYAALKELGACEIHRRSFGPVKAEILRRASAE